MRFFKYGLPILIFTISLSIFLYKLNYSTLAPWDEAWYAVLGRNVLKGDILDLQYNGSSFWDHPPLGYYSIALSFLLFGISEFSARLPMAIFGSLGLVVVYLTGKKMGDWKIGLMASLILFSSRWFLLRSRTANLDSLLLFTQATTFYLLISAKDRKELSWMWFFFGLSMMAKSAISIVMLPLLITKTWMYWNSGVISIRRSFIYFILPLLPWYGYNSLMYGIDFLTQNIFVIGLRKGSASGVSLETIQRTLLYLRSAIHKWYLPLFASSSVGLVFVKFKNIRWIMSYLILSGFPYFASSQSQIWHLIPVMVPMSLLIPVVSFQIIQTLNLRQGIKHLVEYGVLVAVCSIATLSLGSYWKEMINLPRATANEAKMGMMAEKIKLPLVVQDTTYLPTIIFYANKPSVKIIRRQDDIGQIEKPFQIITREFLIKETEGYVVEGQIGEMVLAKYE